MLAGLESLHSLQVMHRDIKCANILIGAGGSLKLADFNVSKVVKQKEGMLYTCPVFSGEIISVIAESSLNKVLLSLTTASNAYD